MGREMIYTIVCIVSSINQSIITKWGTVQRIKNITGTCTCTCTCCRCLVKDQRSKILSDWPRGHAENNSKYITGYTQMAKYMYIDLLRGVSLRDFAQMRKCKCHASWWEEYARAHTLLKTATVVQIHEVGKLKHLQ